MDVEWTSNSQELLKVIPETHQEFSFLDFKSNSQGVSVLGLRYSPTKDTFGFKVHWNEQKLTKRTLLSEASRVFDPIGWLAPVTITFKILFQKLWLLQLDWDDELPKPIKEEWMSIKQHMKYIEQVEINRWLYIEDNELELHGFVDASENAYAAVVYSRVKTLSGVKTNIISAKTKVSPIKTISIPRLELCAAVLGTKLLMSILKTLDGAPKIYLWTDSTIVLDWISSCPRKWKTFVANRVSKILQHTNRNNWRHVPSADNPADCASRGLNPKEFPQFELWWKGPEWLQQQEENWPLQKVSHSEEHDELSKEARIPIVMLASCDDNWVTKLLDRCSSISKVLNTIARILRLARNIRVVKDKRMFGPILAQETVDAFNFLIKACQGTAFKAEIKAIANNKILERDSKLISFYPFIDKKGILRVGGRIEKSTVSYGVKHPIILPPKHRLTMLIIRECHLKHFHAGPMLLTSTLKQKYHILRGKDEVRKVLGQCVTCARLKARQQQQLMGQLPISRVSYNRPFLETGVDYAGPLQIKASRLRGAKIIKCYLAVFICMATKAVHLELVSDMTTEAFLAALKRFQGRRGICAHIHSDNGSNFIGAAKELKRVFETVLQHEDVMNYARSNNINWHFIPPGAPHFGGI